MSELPAALTNLKTQATLGLHLKFSVGAIAGFTPTGDINARVTHQTSAMEGMQTHQRLQRSRGPAYQKEKTVRTIHALGPHQLSINGRADGYHPGDQDQPAWVEEIKTTRTPIDSIPDSVKLQHHNQLVLYGHLICIAEQLSEIELRLNYVNPDSAQETVITTFITAQGLADAFEALLDPVITWFSARADWFQKRNRALNDLSFPFAKFRAGQRQIAEAVYRSSLQDGQLLLQAPTGLGKSMSSLFPVLKSLPTTQVEKIFYLSAKTAGQASAEDALAHIHAQQLPIRSLTITAKRKACFNPEHPCDPNYCDYAKGYFDRLPQALEVVRGNPGHWSRGRLAALASEHQLCPFELSLDAAREMDIIVCDYNYLFSPATRLKRFFEERRGRYSILLDELHNLVDRGRDMFSADLQKQQFQTAKKEIRTLYPSCLKVLEKVNRAFLTLNKSCMTAEAAVEVSAQALKPLCTALQQFLTHLESLEAPQGLPQELTQCLFDAHRFLQVFEKLNADYALLLQGGRTDCSVRLACLHPAQQLQEGYALADSLVGFSATLSPRAYYGDLLGFKATSQWLKVPSPFPAEKQLTLIATHIPVSFHERTAAVPALLALILTLIESKPGNYLVFFPSYAFLERVRSAFDSAYPNIALHCQTRDMLDQAVQAFTDTFTHDSQRLGFAVMGGHFSEGIDLIGPRLSGAMIISLGLAPKTLAQDALLRRIQSPDATNAAAATEREAHPELLDGYDVAYRIPALQRVIQTSGRVIRSEQDQGVVVLVDPRFKAPENRAYLPEHWQPNLINSNLELKSSLSAFWQANTDQM
ncbi:MAG: ATP-dependent DNA helicase [Pseudomonadales bacterium]|jgi:DNA excision repair protein ERCC-2